MSEQRKYKTFLLFINLVFVISACGTSSQAQSEIATSVAQTVEAQNSLTEVAALPTITPVPTLETAPAPELTLTETPTEGASNPGCVASAALVSENPPDKTLFQPGEYFYKTWTFRNTGTCIWTTEYKLIFWDGDLMGGLTSYAMPDDVQPGGTINISIYLQAPTTEGTAKGYWRFQTPWNTNFGVGDPNTSFYVEIGVAVNAKYGITNVEYTLIRDPVEGCPQNTKYNVYAKVTASGPIEFSYYWDQSDGNEGSPKKYTFKEAGTATFKRLWIVGKGDSPNPRWVQFVLMGSQSHDYGKVIIDHFSVCPWVSR
jgi:hypothetical protein